MASQPLENPRPLDRSAAEPLYSQLQHAILESIRNGELVRGQPIPTGKELQDAFGVSSITVRRALSELVSDGYLVREPGRGTFLLRDKLRNITEKLGGVLDDLEVQGFTVQSRILVKGRRAVTAGIARKLAVDDDDLLFYFERLILAGGEPMGLGSAYVNVEEAVELTSEELERESIYPLLQRKCGISLPRAEQTIEAALPVDREVEVLSVKAGTPVLVINALVYDDSDRPVVYGKGVYRGDRYKYFCEINE
jgi:GntR family transcriptional regulator